MDLLAKHVASDACAMLPKYVTEQLHNKLNDMWKCKRSIRYSVAPCCVQLSRANLRYLKNDVYTAAEKTHGERAHLMFVTLRDSNDRSYMSIVFVDRACTFMQVRGTAPSFMFHGTLLDGELIESAGGQSLEFRIFDLISSGGEPCGFRGYIFRIRRARSLLEAEGLELPASLKLTVKSPCMARDLPQLLRRIEDLPDGQCDGIVFTPVNWAVKTGTNPRTLKYKNGMPTVDLFVDSAGGLSASGSQGQRVACGSDPVIAKKGRFVLAQSVPLPEEGQPGEVFEFLVTLERKGVFLLQYERARPEKQGRANHVNTVASIMEEVVENITLQEIVEAIMSGGGARRPEGARGVKLHMLDAEKNSLGGRKPMTQGAVTRLRNLEKKKLAKEAEAKEME